MHQESQNIEWKESWRDEYLKWICGFANAHGGKIYIGKDDAGRVVGIKDAAKLLEEIPNKVKDILGIIVDVNLLNDNGKSYLEIDIEAYPYPISYKGQYHYRSGSTKQELKGAALDTFLLRKQGKRWDGVPVPNVSDADLAPVAFDYFRKKAIKSKRLDSDILQFSLAELLEKLQLTEGTYLKRAALLLFHPDPEKYVTGAYVKIGYFRTDTDLIFQDEIHGHLFEQVEKTMDLLLTKYLKAYIHYEGWNRVEDYQIPETALREAVLNAIAHKDYSGNTPIQIRVYPDKVVIWNQGQLPENWTVAQLLQAHPSVPYNPAIANVFFRAGLIEAWGSGILRMVNDCEKNHAPIPVFRYDFSGFIIEFKAKKTDSSKKMSVIGSVKSSEKSSEKILKLMREQSDITIEELAKKIGISTRAIEKHIQNLKTADKITRKGSDKLGVWEVRS
jgi:ATP-dependent DNA helicase RecG